MFVKSRMISLISLVSSFVQIMVKPPITNVLRGLVSTPLNSSTCSLSNGKALNLRKEKSDIPPKIHIPIKLSYFLLLYV